MRLRIRRPLTGLLAVAAIALGAMGSVAMASSNGPDAYIGIIGGSPQQYTYSANGNINTPYPVYNPGDGVYPWGLYNGPYYGGYHNGY